ncbi:MAG: hypothetical protein AAF383_22860 [Cyanobacteria bacterium P01_A01_bin.83]
MNKFSLANQSPIKQVGITLGLLLTAFLISAAIGYTCQIWVNNGNGEVTKSFDIKRGFLGMLLIVVPIVIGSTQTYLKSKFKLPFFASLGIVFGLANAILDGAQTLLQGEPSRLWLNASGGFIQGVISGSIAGILIQKTQKTDNA